MFIPESVPHDNFEKNFIDWCAERNLNVIDLSYHHNLLEVEANKLRANTFPATLQYRTSPDFLVLGKDISMYVELKTGNMKDKICLEAFPLMVNQIHENLLNIPCLYVYKGVATNNIERCCYSSQIKPSRLIIPQNKIKNNNIIQLLKNYYKDTDIQEKRVSNKFSGDAFIEVDGGIVNSWKNLDEII